MAHSQVFPHNFDLPKVCSNVSFGFVSFMIVNINLWGTDRDFGVSIDLVLRHLDLLSYFFLVEFQVDFVLVLEILEGRFLQRTK